MAGAIEGEDLVGACTGFCSPPAASSSHSDIAGVVKGMRGRNVGHALKLDRRAWAFERGIGEVTWIFGPLVRRNAYFNLCKLAATATEYLPDFYGHMHEVQQPDSAEPGAHHIDLERHPPMLGHGPCLTRSSPHQSSTARKPASTAHVTPLCTAFSTASYVRVDVLPEAFHLTEHRFKLGCAFGSVASAARNSVRGQRSRFLFSPIDQ